MFEWLFGGKVRKLEDQTKIGFSAVKKDMEVVGKWIKHLDGQDKQLFDSLQEIKQELSTIRDEVESLREGVGIISNTSKDKQLLKLLKKVFKQVFKQAVFMKFSKIYL